MVYGQDETNWLLRLQNNSRERIHSARMGFGYNPPVHQQKAEAAANFSVMKTIARKNNPKAVTVLNQLERLCMNTLDGKVSDKQFVQEAKRISKQGKISNPVLDLLDDFIINQSDIHPNRNQTNKASSNPMLIPNNPYANLKNPAFEKPKANKKAPAQKTKDVFGYNPAFDYGGHKNEFALGIKNPALDGTWEKKAKQPVAKKVHHPNHSNHPTLKEPRNPYANLKNPFLASQNKKSAVTNQVSSGRRSARAPFDPWALQNPAFADLKKSKKKNPMGWM